MRALLLVLVSTAAAFAAEPIATLKPLYPATPLVSDGRAACVIVAPTLYRAEADRLALVLADLTRVRPEILADTELVSAAWEVDFTRLGRRHVVALGNVNSNRLQGLLWGAGYVAEDDAFPGTGGWVVRTVHDPFAQGLNVVALAADSPVGLRHAADALVANHLQVDATGWQVPGPVLQVRRGAPPAPHAESPAVALAAVNPRDAIDFPSPADFADSLDQRVLDQVSVVQDEAGARVATLSNLTGVLAQLGRAWFYTGDVGYAAVMKRLVDEHRGLLEVIPRRVEMEPASAAAMHWWDLVEELPVWTDADRLALTNAFLRDARQGHEHTPAHELVREGYVQVLTENHGTNSALNTYEHWRYFAKYYDLAEESYWLAVVRAVFAGQLASHQILEDAALYTPFAPEDAALYALRSCDLRYFQLGIARTQMEFILQVCTTNLGLSSGFGDSRLLRFPWAYQPVALMGWWERDPRVAWWLRTYLPSTGLATWSPAVPLDLSVTPREPVEWTGLTVFPLYRQVLGREKESRMVVTSPREPMAGWFNKVVFRERWSPEAHYLLLDGAGSSLTDDDVPRGPIGHSHGDINTINTFTDLGRMWLVDHTYAERAPQDHSGVAVSRDGVMHYVNRPARLDVSAQGGGLALTRSTSRGFSGVDWERTVFWRKGHHFLVIDRAVAREEGDYVARCNFKALGAVLREGAELRLEQAGRHFQIVSDGNATTSVVSARFPNADAWIGVYPHAEPVARHFEQFKSSHLEPGGELRFANLLRAGESPAELDGAAVRLAGPDAVLVTSGGEEHLYGRARLPDDLGVCDSYAWAADDMLLAGLSRLGPSDTPWLTVSAPVDLWGSVDGDLILRCTEPVSLAWEGRLREIPAGEQVLARDSGTFRTIRGVVLAAARAAATTPAPGATPTHLDAPALPVTRAIALGMPVTKFLAVDLEGDGELDWLASGPEGFAVFRTDGRLRWRFAPGTACGALAAADIDGDGRMEIAVGAADERVYLLGADGRERWRFACKASYMSDPPVPDDVRIADLDNDGNAEIVVAANWVHVLRADGKLRWEDYWRYQRGRYVGDVQSIDLKDIDSDGRTDIVCGIRLNYPVALAYDPDGRRIYPRLPQKQPNHQPLRVDPPNDTLVLDLFADAGPPQIVVAASSQLNVRWVGGELDTKRAADLPGGRVALAAAVTSPGGRPLLVSATDMGAVFAYRAQGARGDGPTIDLRSEWMRLIGEKITALEAVAADDDVQIWVGTQSGRAHLLLAASGRPLGSTPSTGSPVVQVAAGRDGVNLVHADGIIETVGRTSLSSIP